MRFTVDDSRFTLNRPLASRLLPLAFSLSALALMLWGFAQVDIPLVRFMRSIHIVWLEQAGDAVNRLGDGWTLVLISAALLSAGLIFKLPQVRAAGLWSLIAHGAAGLVVQLLKRLIGRPRPRYTHGDEQHLAPSLVSGFDSFPSGHAIASFAVAAVLAKYFPRGAWAFYGLAALVAVSRAVRGSHFATDVAVGAALGVCIGLFIANFQGAGQGARWEAPAAGLVQLTPYLAVLFGLLWVMVHGHHEQAFQQVALALGAAMVLAGLGSRLWRRLRPEDAPGWLPTVPLADGLIAVGLAVSTGSILVAVLGALVALDLWLIAPGYREDPEAVLKPGNPSSVRARTYLSEVTRGVALGLSLAAIQGMKGLLPLL